MNSSSDIVYSIIMYDPCPCSRCPIPRTCWCEFTISPSISPSPLPIPLPLPRPIHLPPSFPSSSPPPPPPPPPPRCLINCVAVNSMLRPVVIPVEVPVVKFRDHFVPVPVRRRIVPKIVFTDERYAVECVKEKPLLIVEDYNKPVPVDVSIKLKERDIKVAPMNPSDMSQGDYHAMWMRVNADLLDVYKETNDGELPPPVRWQDDNVPTDYDQYGNPITAMRTSPAAHPSDVDLGPLPLHPGHPLMMTYLQNQWMQDPSTLTHNMYDAEFFRLHASALNSLTDPQPHQINLTEAQAMRLSPLPNEVLPGLFGGPQAYSNVMPTGPDGGYGAPMMHSPPPQQPQQQQQPAAPAPEEAEAPQA
eukprot:GHVU01069152.1.p1 GENE.GHVU01069152.1~~GHVU01069152.1.p1  ORF type:complete len:361 (+),score=78.02 GHVU01069152.1:167-1249(+)